MVLRNLKFGEEVEQVVRDTRWVSSMYRLKKFHFVSGGLFLIYCTSLLVKYFQFMIQQIQLHILYVLLSSVYATNMFILLDAEFLIHSILLFTCFSNKEPLFPYAILAIDLKIYKQVSMAEWLGHRSLQINTMKWIKYR